MTHNSIVPTRLGPALRAVLCTLPLAGCGGEAPRASVFDEIARLPSREELLEVTLGSFFVPIPMALESPTQQFEPENLMRLELELVAVIDPARKKQVKVLQKRNAGRLRDQVIRVCRSTPHDDLIEAQKATLKAHLLDAVQPLLGGDAVRKLVVKRVNIEEL